MRRNEPKPEACESDAVSTGLERNRDNIPSSKVLAQHSSGAASPKARRLSRGEQGLALALGLALLLPVLVYPAITRDSFWFGDEFDLLLQIRNEGLLQWSFQLFSENFMPVFKLFWGSLIFISGGSYSFMLWTLWLFHALNGYLLARILLRLRYSWVAAAASVLGFGLTAITIETMTWSVQLCVVLCGAFFLAALEAYLDQEELAGERRSTLLRQAGWTIASAWTFARGTAAGPVLAFLSLAGQGDNSSRTRRIGSATTLLVVPVGTALLILLGAPGARHAAVESRHMTQPLSFALWAFGSDPLGSYFLVKPTWFSVSALGSAKLALFLLVLLKEKGARRTWLLGLALFEVANCGLLGLGRYTPQLELAASSRYQYIALLTTFPFVGIALERLCACIPGKPLRHGIGFLLVGALAWAGFRLWEPSLPGWIAGRGTAGRELLLRSDPVPRGHDVPGIPGMDNRTAARLVRRYDLH